jgi:hypothetical protein
MAVHGDERIRSATFFVTLMDFRESGELNVFIDEEQIKAIEDKMNRRGYLEGNEMATTFNTLRANDLIWSFVVNNYLLGNDLFPFDLLYWNSDSTRTPARMHSFYLRAMYQENRLITPGGISLAETPIDLARVTMPAYFLSTPRTISHRGRPPGAERACWDLARNAPAGRSHSVRARRLGPHRRCGEPAGSGQVQPLDQSRAGGGPTGVVQRRHGDRRLLVARPATLGQRVGPAAGRRAPAG